MVKEFFVDDIESVVKQFKNMTEQLTRAIDRRTVRNSNDQNKIYELNGKVTTRKEEIARAQKLKKKLEEFIV